MRIIQINLKQASPSSAAINLQDEEQYLYSELITVPANKNVFHERANAQGNNSLVPSGENHKTRLTQDIYGTIRIHADFAPSESANGSLHLGSWTEIVAIDLSKNFPLFYQEKENDVYFIGLHNQNHLRIQRLPNGGVMLTRRLITGGVTYSETNGEILYNSPVLARIDGVIQTMDENLSNPTFVANQTTHRNQRLEKTQSFLMAY